MRLIFRYKGDVLDIFCQIESSWFFGWTPLRWRRCIFFYFFQLLSSSATSAGMMLDFSVKHQLITRVDLLIYWWRSSSDVNLPTTTNQWAPRWRQINVPAYPSSLLELPLFLESSNSHNFSFASQSLYFRLFFKTIISSSSSSDDEEASRMARFFGISSSKRLPTSGWSVAVDLFTISPVSSAPGRFFFVGKSGESLVLTFNKFRIFFQNLNSSQLL